MAHLIDLLSKMDEVFDNQEPKNIASILLTHGEQLFPIIFKLTHYDKQFVISNTDDFTKIEPMSHEKILQMLSTIDDQNSEDKINILVNNLLLRNIFEIKRGSKDQRMCLLLAIAEIIFEAEKMIATKKLARILFYLGFLIDQVPLEDQHSFLAGTMFALGGLLKIEARNFLETKIKYDSSLVITNMVEESKTAEDSMQRAKRDLSQADIEYFESESGFLQVMKLFVSKIIVGKKGSIKASDFDYYLDWSSPEFLDRIDEEKKKNGARIAQLEAAHYVLNFLFDLLQFSCQYLVKVTKFSLGDDEVQDQQPKRFNPMEDLSIEEDFCMPLEFKYFIHGFEGLIKQICESIEDLCP